MGRTATINAADGSPAGYMYYADYDQGYKIGDKAWAKRFSILVSGRSQATDPSSEQVKSSLDFTADVMREGLSRDTTAGL